MSLLRRWRRLWTREDPWELDLEEEVEQEIETHLALRVEALVRAGMSPGEAEREAARRFGDLPAAVNALRDGARRRLEGRRSRARLDGLTADLRLAFRQMRRSPRFTLVTLATLALGIGGTTATFTLLRSVVLEPLPFPHAEQLVALQSQDSLHDTIQVVSGANWIDWRRSARTLAGTALYGERRMALQLGTEPVRLEGALVTAGFFEVLETRLVEGRGFTEQEVGDRTPVAVVSEALWRRLPVGAPADPRRITVDSRTYDIVGVLARGQEFPEGVQVYLPLRVNPEGGGLRNNINWFALARLAPGVTLAQAQAELDGIAQGIRSTDPAGIYSYGVPVIPLQTAVVGDTAGYLGILMGAVLLVLAVACVNLAAGHLARGLVRSRETAVRAALGADRSRLVQQVLLEHGVLGLIGGGLGVLLAWGGLHSILRLYGERIPRAAEVSLDLWVVVFAAVASLGAGLLTALAPAFQASRPFLSGLMARGGRSQVAGGRSMPGALLVTAELALALVLLTGAGLLIRSLQSLLSRDLGFETNVVTVSATLSGFRYAEDESRRLGYWDQVIGELSALPGAVAAGVANWIPLGQVGGTFVELESGAEVTGGFGYRAVSEDYLRTLGVPLLAGRFFGPEDGPATGRVALVSRSAAERAWPGQDPIGRRFRALSMERGPRGEPAPWLTVVGVVADLRQWGPYRDPRPEAYVLFRQVSQFATAMTAVVRASTPAAGLVASARRQVQTVDPTVALEVGTLDQSLTRLLAPQRLPVSLLTGFGVFALLLTGLGLYGLLSYSVSRRAREFALRAALGARRVQLVQAAAVAGIKPVFLGGVIGLGAALGLSRLMESLLVDVTPFDPLTYLLVLLLVLLVALIAIIIPAARVVWLDPAAALKAE